MNIIAIVIFGLIVNLTINKGLDPMSATDKHAGVHHIRKYYPDYIPTREDFEGAYWGSKPQEVKA